MCYYNGQKITQTDHISLKNLEKSITDLSFLNRDLQIGFDYNLSAVLKKIKDQQDFEITQMEWGFIPFYLKTREEVFKMRNGFKDATGKFHPPVITLNAVAEELLQPGKIYREAALKRRCLVLSTGFYEWRHVYPLNKRTGQPLKTSQKYPYYISLKEKPYFYMAGLWQPWTDKATGEHVESFAIVTTKANRLMEQIHNSKKRMPTILPDDLAYEWLLQDLDEKRISEIATFQYPSEKMQACSIAKDFREVLEPSRPFAYEDLPAIEMSVRPGSGEKQGSLF